MNVERIKMAAQRNVDITLHKLGTKHAMTFRKK